MQSRPFDASLVVFKEKIRYLEVRKVGLTPLFG
jgi:hypothetical protein